MCGNSRIVTKTWFESVVFDINICCFIGYGLPLFATDYSGHANARNKMFKIGPSKYGPGSIFRSSNLQNAILMHRCVVVSFEQIWTFFNKDTGSPVARNDDSLSNNSKESECFALRQAEATCEAKQRTVTLLTECLQRGVVTYDVTPWQRLMAA